ncbi:MAG TPA: DNA ligase D [Solirubrobacteraceae bacterium]|nr:DNA ligase D [Solirubrobacteraceae bacterium]
MAADKLGAYRDKRDFKRTQEPSGEVAAAAGERLRFVVQEHHARRLHWDLRLERDGVAVSFAVPNGIPQTPKENRLAVHTEDHPLEYLEWEGEIPKGEYGAGTMFVWDRGTYELHKWEERKIEITFHGERLHGRYGLFPIGRGSENANDWMIHRMDPPEDPDRVAMPEHLRPMLARPGEVPREESKWSFEVKWDGVRAIAYSQPGRFRLESRNLNEITAAYPEVRGLMEQLGMREAVLDGEIVAFDEHGKPSFERLQSRMHVTGAAQIKRLQASTPVVYAIFDLLHLDGESLMSLAYTERRARLAELELGGPAWRVPEAHPGHGRALLHATEAQGLEGIVAKRLDSRYDPGARNGCWLKIKHTRRQELVIGGWLPGEGRRRERIGALLMGYFSAGDLRFAGRVGTGFGEKTLDDLGRRLAPLQTDQNPFTPKPKLPRGAVYVEPALVAEIEFREWTREGVMRAPSFKGMREDKPAVEVIREDPPGLPELSQQASSGRDSPFDRFEEGRAGAVTVEVDGRELKLSNWDKVLFPATGFTKGDLITFYARAADAVLPHLHDRALTLKRYPGGVTEPHFYEKQSPSHRPEWVQTQRVKDINYTLCQDRATLVWLANLADIELHTSLSLAQAPERPTMLVFDLDPGAPAGLLECCQVGLVLRGMFGALGLETCVKTSGSKGLQVYVPLNTEVTYEQTKPFARHVAELLEQRMPELVVSRMTKAIRRGRVLVDWSQNDDHKTTACVYSVRALERPGVSTPLSWEEVEACRDAKDPARLVFSPEQVLARVAIHGDLFAPVLHVVQGLPRA